VQAPRRIPELDGLRGVAIGLVLFYHCFFLIAEVRPGSALSYLFSVGRLGWSGVDLFFVLSGFLIGGILLDARGASNFYPVFYTRRFFRIVPAYSILLLAYIVLSNLAAGQAGLRLIADCPLPVAPYFLFLQNFWMGAHNTLGGTTLGVTWSLAIEEQFYLTLPLLIRFTPSRRLVSVLLAGVGLAEVLRVVLYWSQPANWAYYRVLMPCRADALLLGVLGAYAMKELNWRHWLENRRRYLWIPLSIFAVGMGIMVRVLPKTGDVLLAAGGYTLIALFFLSLLMYSLLVRESWLSRCLRWNCLRALGTIAYGTYLFHFLIFNAFFAIFRASAPRIVTSRDLLIACAALGATFAVCALSWRYFEKPLLRKGHSENYQFETKDAEEAVFVGVGNPETVDVC
jgi:peptidoglycan/LPS O-acetylase OafA/YrhL